MPQRTLIQKENRIYLINIETQRPVAEFTQPPSIVSGVFILSEDKKHLYTVLGYEVVFPRGAVIESVFNYWVIYYLNNKKILSHLDIYGLEFILSDVLEIEDYGLLSSRGVTVLINGYWRTFYYLGKFIEDYREPYLNPSVSNIRGLIASGFSKSYLSVLIDSGIIEISDDLNKLNETDIKMGINNQMAKDVKEISTLSSMYTSQQIAQVLNVENSIAEMYIEYTKLGSWES